MECLSVVSRSYDTATGEVSLREVTDTFVRTSDHINYLTIVDEHGNEQTIETTDGHPFWVVTDTPDLSRAACSVADGLYHENVAPTEHGFWVEAKDLRVGDVFLGANGELSTLTNAVRVEFAGNIAVYNFSVEGNHNYFVIANSEAYNNGVAPVLVHNAKKNQYQVTVLEPGHPDKLRYEVNTEHLPGPDFKSWKTSLPPDAQAVYDGTILHTTRKPGTYYGKANKDEIYRYFSKNHDAAHFSASLKPTDQIIPIEIRRMLDNM